MNLQVLHHRFQGVELKMHYVTLFQPHAGSVLLNGNLLRFVRMITKLMSYVSVYFIALTNFYDAYSP